ncbi:NC domain-containing protein-related [Raphanus sativus]|nr:NC domain-containing protein-related [Raphanus sativus]
MLQRGSATEDVKDSSENLNKISKDENVFSRLLYIEVVEGQAYICSHHGIYIAVGKVIHFTRGGGLEIETGTFLDKLIVSAVTNHGRDNPCPNNCGKQSNTHRVISSGLECFLSGCDLLLFEYGVSPALLMVRRL